MIEFLCPQGHRIRCPDEQAGRPAKCPKCGVKFRIPTIEEMQGGPPGQPESPASAPEVTESPGAGSSAGGNGGRPAGSSKEPQIEFLCPNGHHLHGPASLQGRPGECPECGSRFRIPSLEEMSVEAPEEEIRLEGSSPTNRPSSVETSAAEWEGMPASPPAKVTAQGASSTTTSAVLAPTTAVSGSAGVHPLGELFAQLWAAKGDASRVEVHLESGGVILPDGFVPSLSQQQSAVLVTRDADDTHTVTVVPWDSIARIILRGIQEVPGEVVR